MEIFSWKACTCGLFQVCFLYKLEAMSLYSVLIPSYIFLVFDLAECLFLVYREEYLTQRKSLECLVRLATVGLCLTSLLLFAESKEAGLDTFPALVPIFMIFLLHSFCRVLLDPPLFLAPMINLLAPPLAVCSISGSCSSLYLSIFSSFFGAFGTSFVDFFEILRPLTFVLLIITVLSVYSSVRQVVYGPFLLACGSCGVILAGELLENIVFITCGNIALVVSVLWNNRNLRGSEWKSV